MPTGTFFYYQQIGLEASVLKQGTALAYIILNTLCLERLTRWEHFCRPPAEEMHQENVTFVKGI